MFSTPFVFGHPLFFAKIIIFSIRKHWVFTVYNTAKLRTVGPTTCHIALYVLLTRRTILCLLWYAFKDIMINSVYYLTECASFVLKHTTMLQVKYEKHQANEILSQLWQIKNFLEISNYKLLLTLYFLLLHFLRMWRRNLIKDVYPINVAYLSPENTRIQIRNKEISNQEDITTWLKPIKTPICNKITVFGLP